eukprot:6998757-Prymnesium_polylepis.2
MVRGPLCVATGERHPHGRAQGQGRPIHAGCQLFVGGASAGATGAAEAGREARKARAEAKGADVFAGADGGAHHGSKNEPALSRAEAARPVAVGVGDSLPVAARLSGGVTQPRCTHVERRGPRVYV